MPFCREDPCLLPNIRARSRGCPSRFRSTSADGGMRSCFCRRRAVRAARNGVSSSRCRVERKTLTKRLLLPSERPPNTYHHAPNTRPNTYALEPVPTVPAQRVVISIGCNWLLQPIDGLAKKLAPQLYDQVWPPGVIGTCAAALQGLPSVRASIGAAETTLRASSPIHKRLDVIDAAGPPSAAPARARGRLSSSLSLSGAARAPPSSAAAARARGADIEAKDQGVATPSPRSRL